MDFKKFDPPPTESHALNTGLSAERGVTAKSFVEGVNAHFEHVLARLDSLEASVKLLSFVLDAQPPSNSPTSPNSSEGDSASGVSAEMLTEQPAAE